MNTHQPRTNPQNKMLGLLLFVPVFLAIVVSAWVNLQLFQDGAAYLYDIVQSRSTVAMHQRFSATLVQVPIVLSLHLLALSSIEDAMPLMRFAFCLGYGLMPLLCLLLSWRIVQPATKSLLIWPWLIIVLVNLVNFSWVSEILMALQLSCPMLLGVCCGPIHQIDGHKLSRWRWFLTLGLSGVILGLHPLTVFIFGIATVGCLYLSIQYNALVKGADQPNETSSNAVGFYRRMALFFGGLTIAKGGWAIASMSAYEKVFLEAHQRNTYLFSSSTEDRLFLLGSLVIGGLCLLAQYVHQRSKSISWLYGVCIGEAIASACILMSQYSHYPLQLKTGLSISVSLFLLLLMFIDVAKLHRNWLQERQPHGVNTRFRQRLMVTLSLIFLTVVLAQAFLWNTAIHQLRTVMAISPTECMERYSSDFDWIYQPPYQMLNNWSLPVLALLQGDRSTPTVFITDNCQGYETLYEVNIYPWKAIPKDEMRPQL